MINRRVTRTVLNLTETTDKTNSISTDALGFVIGVSDSFYLGFYGKFASRYFKLGTLNTNAVTVSLSYWDGSAFTAVDDLVDQTVGFTKSGFIHWQNKDDWKQRSLTGIDSDIELYWVKLTVSGSLSAGTTLQAVLPLLCDDELVGMYYPELISDTRWLPTEGNFLKQYLAAKDLVVLRLRQRRLIEDESQIIDVNGVEIAAVHAAAKIILQPIATGEEMQAWLGRASREFDNEVSQLALNVDQNKDGQISSAERHDFGETFIRRR
jgi:hypothetical protein